MPTPKAKKEAIKLSPQEEASIKAERERNERAMRCWEEVKKTLQEHKCVLDINPNSPFSNPQIIIVAR